MSEGSADGQAGGPHLTPTAALAWWGLAGGWLMLLGWIHWPAWLDTAAVVTGILALLLIARRLTGQGLWPPLLVSIALSAAGWGLLGAAFVRMTPAEALSYLANTQWDFVGHSLMANELIPVSQVRTSAFGDPWYPFNDYPQGGAHHVAAGLRPLTWLGLLKPSTPEAAASITFVTAVWSTWCLSLPATAALFAPHVERAARAATIIATCAVLALGPLAVILSYGHTNFALALGFCAALTVLVTGMDVTEGTRPTTLLAVALGGGCVAVLHTYPPLLLLYIPVAGVSLRRLWRASGRKQRRVLLILFSFTAFACLPQVALTGSSVERFADTAAGLGGPVSVSVLVVAAVGVALARRMPLSVRVGVLASCVGLMLAAGLAQLNLTGSIGYYPDKWGWGVALILLVTAVAGLIAHRPATSMALGGAALLFFGASGPLTPLFSDLQAIPARLNISYLGSRQYPAWPGNVLLACADVVPSRTAVLVYSDRTQHPRSDILSMWMSFLHPADHGKVWAGLRTVSQVQTRGYSVTDALAYTLANDPSLGLVANQTLAARMRLENPALASRIVAEWSVDGAQATCHPPVSSR